MKNTNICPENVPEEYDPCRQHMKVVVLNKYLNYIKYGNDIYLKNAKIKIKLCVTQKIQT